MKMQVRKADTGRWWVLFPEDGTGYAFRDWRTAFSGSKWVANPRTRNSFVPSPIEDFKPWAEPDSRAEWERKHRWVTTPGTKVYVRGREFVTGESKRTGPDTASVPLIPVDKWNDPRFYE